MRPGRFRNSRLRPPNTLRVYKCGVNRRFFAKRHWIIVAPSTVRAKHRNSRLFSSFTLPLPGTFGLNN